MLVRDRVQESESAGLEGVSGEFVAFGEKTTLLGASRRDEVDAVAMPMAFAPGVSDFVFAASVRLVVWMRLT